MMCSVTNTLDVCIWSQSRHAKQYLKIVYINFTAKIENLYVK